MFASRFKAYLIPHSALPQEAARLEPWLGQLAEIYLHEARQSAKQAPELAFRILTLYLESRSPGSWWRARQGVAVCNRPQELVDFWQMGLQDFYCRYRLAYLPESLLNFLGQWQEEELPLMWVAEPPTCRSLLDEQCQGRRVLTFCFNRAIQGKLVDGRRDCFEFMLHDLVHAALFFGPHHQEQVAFFKVFRSWLVEWLGKLPTDTQFAQEIDYIMADMNSVTPHMVASVRASLIALTKRHLGLDKNQRLGSQQESLWQEPYEHLIANLEIWRVENGPRDP